jgi:kynureninase
MTRADCLARDAADPLAALRTQFDLARLDAAGIVYLDGNSLGPLPTSVSARLAAVAGEEWGRGLVGSWNSADWIAWPARVGDRLASLLGVGSGEAIVADSTSVNLMKALSAAAALASRGQPGRRSLVVEQDGFPTDLYIAAAVARAHRLDLVRMPSGQLPAHFDSALAVLLLTHVNYRTGRMHDMADVNLAAHAAGGLVVWDLAHSAGAVPLALHGGSTEEAADFAVGCGYKYLNGGPGAPAFAWAHPRHIAWMDREGWRQPLSGWLGHAAPFDFTSDYRPAPGMSRFTCGTPPILSLAALECGVDTVLAAEPHGGLEAIRRKSNALADVFVELVESRCADYGLSLVSPREQNQRGSQICFAHADGGYPIMQALIARGVIGDFRAPDILRFGFTPLYTRFVDIWDAVDRLRQVLESGEWQEPRFAVRAAVT